MLRRTIQEMKDLSKNPNSLIQVASLKTQGYGKIQVLPGEISILVMDKLDTLYRIGDGIINTLSNFDTQFYFKNELSQTYQGQYGQLKKIGLRYDYFKREPTSKLPNFYLSEHTGEYPKPETPDFSLYLDQRQQTIMQAQVLSKDEAINESLKAGVGNCNTNSKNEILQTANKKYSTFTNNFNPAQIKAKLKGNFSNIKSHALTDINDEF